MNNPRWADGGSDAIPLLAVFVKEEDGEAAAVAVAVAEPEEDMLEESNEVGEEVDEDVSEVFVLFLLVLSHIVPIDRCINCNA